MSAIRRFGVRVALAGAVIGRVRFRAAACSGTDTHPGDAPAGERTPAEHDRRGGAGAQAERRPRGGADQPGDPGRQHRPGAGQLGADLHHAVPGRLPQQPAEQLPVGRTGDDHQQPEPRSTSGSDRSCPGTDRATGSAGTTTGRRPTTPSPTSRRRSARRSASTSPSRCCATSGSTSSASSCRSRPRTGRSPTCSCARRSPPRPAP